MGPEWEDLAAAAAGVDAALGATPFPTLLHGDFKTDNLLFSQGVDGWVRGGWEGMGGSGPPPASPATHPMQRGHVCCL